MKNVFERYGYYLKFIRLLGNMPITASATPKSLGMDAASTQMAYREIKETKFHGTVVPYLAYISCYYLFECWASRLLSMDRRAIPMMVSGALLQDCMADQPVDGINTLRSFPMLPLLNPDPAWSESLATLKTLEGYSAAAKHAITILGQIASYFSEDGGIDEEEYNLPNSSMASFTNYYLRIQSVNRGDGPSFPSISENQPNPTQPLTPSSSDDLKKATRSGASSQEAPSGASPSVERSLAIRPNQSLVKIPKQEFEMAAEIWKIPLSDGRPKGRRTTKPRKRG